ncbi:MAG: Lrp/AsnC ligand binding domain-containing protein [Deltaproteobacteria bacterium]|nr:Lrp/AsnC ligand binding domain-containing protein [Deltaproteobacteria bacterium]
MRCLDAAQLDDEAFDPRDRGLRTVPLARIVGSVGRYQDFDARFRLRPSERLMRIKQAMRQGAVLPPVRLYQVRDEYYVLDGNHRIAAARELGHDDILAHIVELVPSKDTLDNVIFRERADFADQTGLSAEIRLTEVGQYAHLLAQIRRHQQYLAAGEKPDADFKTAAEDWYRTIYRPLCRIIQQAGLMAGFPDRRISDLYAYISHYLWEEGRPRQYGPHIDQSIPKDMEAFRTMIAERRNADQYPEMKRTITAFVLLNVQGKHEFKIMEKLFDLDEVVEIHSVHGDIDLLAKIVLSRDLLASDAEVISQFVTEKVRLVPGVNSTKTLIPGSSKVKPAPDEN